MSDVARAIKLIDAVERLGDKRYDALAPIIRRAEALAEAIGPSGRAWLAVPNQSDTMSLRVEGDILVMSGHRYIGDGDEEKTYRLPLDYANGERPDAQAWLERMRLDRLEQQAKAEAEKQAGRELAERLQYERLRRKFEV